MARLGATGGGFVATERTAPVIAAAGHLPVVGSSLGAGPVAAAVLEAMAEMKWKRGTVSFDPNICKEMLVSPGLRAAMERVITETDLFLPSGVELQLFSDRPASTSAIRDLIDRGIGAIVHKQGAQGARYVDRSTDIVKPAFPVEELDRTDAGDISGATFVVGWLRGLARAENLRLACAAGARAVTRKGPMEGVSSHAELILFLAESAGR